MIFFANCFPIKTCWFTETAHREGSVLMNFSIQNHIFLVGGRGGNTFEMVNKSHSDMFLTKKFQFSRSKWLFCLNVELITVKKHPTFKMVKRGMKCLERMETKCFICQFAKTIQDFDCVPQLGTGTFFKKLKYFPRIGKNSFPPISSTDVFWESGPKWVGFQRTFVPTGPNEVNWSR